MREGALDYLPKPVDHEHLVLTVSRAIEQRRIVTENLLLKEALGTRHGAPTIIGEHPGAARGAAQPAAGGADRHHRVAGR